MIYFHLSVSEFPRSVYPFQTQIAVDAQASSLNEDPTQSPERFVPFYYLLYTSTIQYKYYTESVLRGWCAYGLR